MTTYICINCSKKVQMQEKPVDFFCKLGEGHDWRIYTKEGLLRFRTKLKPHTPLVRDN